MKRTTIIIAVLSVALLGTLALLLQSQFNSKPGAATTTVISSGTKTASVSGDVGVPAGMDSFGVTVFAEGTGFMALTDADGRFVVSGLVPGTYKFRASRPDLVSSEMEQVTITPADLEKQQPFRELIRVLMDRSDNNSDTDVMLSTLGGLHGRAVTGAPGDQSGTTVLLEGTRHRTVTDSSGDFALVNVEPGKYDLAFIRSGFSQAKYSISINAGQVAEIPPVTLSAREDATEGDRSVSGHVEILTADGSRLDDLGVVRVTVEGTSFSATPDATGSFQLSGLPPRILTVSASAPGYLLEKKVIANLRDAQTAQVELLLLEDTTATAGTGSIRGRILLASRKGGGQGGGVAVSLAGTSNVAFTNAAGNYLIQNVQAGTYDIVASFNGYKTGTLEGLTIETGETLAPDLTLEEDVEAPTVVTTSPTDRQTNVTISQPTTAIIQFSMAMDSSSVIDAITVSPSLAFRVRSEGGQDLYAIDMDAVAPADGGVPLRYGTRYTVTVASSARSMTGVSMEEDYQFSFTTGYAEIISTAPTNGARGVVVNFDRPLTIHFNAPIDPDSISADDIEFRPSLPSSPTVNFQRDARSGWTTLFVSGFAQPDVNYTVTVRRGVKTITGDRVRNLPYRTSFRTAEWVDLGTLYNTDSKNNRDDARRERSRRSRR
ncbi:carboxypeptidase regulatory-like domain-containing protein [Candidatus Sumerlaeota bacterium]|nr:carboxypeptidase regulatory-like domain-containing protein [Candidatus Sumerlaeota bacterium]